MVRNITNRSADRNRRNALFRAITQDEIASQMRALRKHRHLTQRDLAKLTGMKQSAVCRIEQAEYAAWSLTTLFRVGEALDARWKMTLEPVEDATKEFTPQPEGKGLARSQNR
jgi:transcriptional regulator with XRE-family HTH domain